MQLYFDLYIFVIFYSNYIYISFYICNQFSFDKLTLIHSLQNMKKTASAVTLTQSHVLCLLQVFQP